MFLLACICIHVEVLSHEDHSYYLSFLATFRTSAQNWSLVHHFDMYSWENINAQFVTLEPWDDGLLTRLVGKGEATHEVIFRPSA